MALTKEQTKIAHGILKDNPNISVVYVNPKGEFFTQESYAENSLPKNKDGKRVGQIEKVRLPKTATK